MSESNGAGRVLDYASAYDEKACRSLVEALLADFGAPTEAFKQRKRAEPLTTYRQVARAVAVEQGFHPQCVGRVSSCCCTSVGYAVRSVTARLEKEERKPSKFPFKPVLERARAVAEKWRLAQAGKEAV